MTISKPSVYEPLTESGAISLAIRLGLFPEGTPLACREIGDGNLNLVFHVVDQQTRKGVIIKQALPYAKVVGESWPLTLKRAVIESNALRTFASYVPQYVPKVYYSDESLAITVMEDLSRLQIVRKGLIEGKVYPLLSEHIGEFIAKTLFYTSDFGMNQQQKKQLSQSFVNPELCKITEDLVFTDPFFDHETNNFEDELRSDVETLWADDALHLEVAKLKRKFLTEGDALIHGDLHTGSIFASDTETKVIDPEFAFYGPFGFDIGQFFANLLLNALSRPEQEQEPLLAHVEKTWNVFADVFSALWEQHNVEPYAKTKGLLEEVLRQTFVDAIGFAGCEVIRRTIGLAHVADLDGIEDKNRRLHAKQRALELGRRLILQRQSLNNVGEIRSLFLQTFVTTH
ncbi:S-methyl-5-thioribose kinase [Anoxybacteroides tepidamans]|uniref:S-methyl-5-thioribose kinase n=1 Tax=Anoxybacteroides tepidamans TaxID=265948 RepID=UPI0004862C30|nr:S-methyl-5-thioribose kinase [Anoxybacillus tepidamans]